jgi:hypothetical protein
MVDFVLEILTFLTAVWTLYQEYRLKKKIEPVIKKINGGT